ncbi:MAG: hypothetical protein HYX72_07670 [Acidobacteria bacterium]|nr:hypothetical protein [Acidobacteriota bacterium]
MTKAKVLEEFAAKGAAEVDGKISIRSYKVGPLEFRVAFVFGEEEEERVCPGEKGLCSIQLYGVGDTRLHGWTAFQGLEPQLIEKYGQPSYRTKNAWTERVENMGRGGTSWEMAGK